MCNLTACLVVKLQKDLWNLANAHFLKDPWHRLADVAEDLESKAWICCEII